jgi:hypothetical protein
MAYLGRDPQRTGKFFFKMPQDVNLSEPLRKGDLFACANRLDPTSQTAPVADATPV